MSNCCDIKNPLVRDGVSQAQRHMEALSTDYVKVDERELADFLVFAYEFAKQINYYNIHNQLSGNWEAFFACNTPIWIARISKVDYGGIKADYLTYLEQLLDTYGQLQNLIAQFLLLEEEKERLQGELQDIFVGGLQKNEELSTLEARIQEINQALENLTQTREKQSDQLMLAFNALSNPFRQMLDAIVDWYKNLDRYTPLKNIIKGLVKTNFGLPLQQLQSLTGALEQIDLTFDFVSASLSSIESTFGIVIADQSSGRGILAQSASDLQQNLDDVFQVIFQNFRQMILLAPSYLVASIEGKSDHEPMLALYFTFIELMKYAQDDLNQLTQRHLDFFYRDTLLLPDREAIPDHAHLVFELAKFEEEHKLAAEILFNAGKDQTGVELFYKLEKEIVVTKAQVESLKAISLELKGANLDENVESRQVNAMYISPIANSDDGKGTDFPKEQAVKAWEPFGNSDGLVPLAQDEDGLLIEDSIVGLALASEVFLLQEGIRKVQIVLTYTGNNNGLLSGDLDDIFEIQLSGEKEWIGAEIKNTTNPSWNLAVTSSQITLVAELGSDKDPIIGYTSELPGAKLKTQKPILRILLKSNPDGSTYSYEFIRNLKISHVEVNVHVDKVQNLIVQNEQAVLDPSKPFQPFGAFPSEGANFYIGSQEVFGKALTELELDLTWKDHVNLSTHYDVYEKVLGLSSAIAPSTYKVKAAGLSGNTFHEDSTKKNLFSSSGGDSTNNITLTGDLTNLKLNAAQAVEVIEQFTLDTKSGFIRLQISDGDFFYDDFPNILSVQSLAMARFPDYMSNATYEPAIDVTATPSPLDANNKIIDQSTIVELPNQPYSPVLQSLTLSYQATANTTSNSSSLDLLQLHPFSGYHELDLAESPFLFPFFGEPGSQTTPARIEEGALFIGLKDLAPPTALSILFQVAEETADTDLEKTDLRWYYLHENAWKAFEDYQTLEDDSNGLIRSGIVQLEIPEEFAKGNTLMDPELHWIKVAVRERSGAICHIIGVHTQAAKVTFEDQENDENFLATPLPAGTIAKLQVKEPEIKKVNQLYDSFGGQVKETPEQFYIRISERLRHKQRAVNIFDYERIVLEKFPEIHRVRCINHTDNLRELMPGYVTLAVIPDISQRDTTNDLQPKVNINLLAEIKAYLESLSPCWANIQVLNPLYEEIDVFFEVKFNQANFGFYRETLKTAIVGYLSPWTTGGAADIHFGGKIFRSSILNFVEEQSYVDYVLNFKMNHTIDGTPTNDVREVSASFARSILVSAEADAHTISETQDCPDNELVPGTAGTLGYEPLSELEIQK